MFPDQSSGPPSGAFIPAKYRGTTANPKVSSSMGLSFDLVDGSVCRLLLTVEEMEDLGEAILEDVASYRERMNSHSDSSSGKPSVAVSTPLE